MYKNYSRFFIVGRGEVVLTQKREKFAQGIYKGLSQRKAYREAYPSSRKWKDRTVDTKASELAKNGEVMARIAELRKKEEKAIIDKKVWDFDTAAKSLGWIVYESQRDIKAKGIRGANSKAFIDAVKELNDMYGYGVERKSRVDLNNTRVEQIKSDMHLSKEDTQESKVADLLQGVLDDVYEKTE